MKIVLDTNIYIASLLSEGLCFKLVEFTFGPESEHSVFISNEIWLELENKIQEKSLNENFYLPQLQKNLHGRGFWVIPTEKITNTSRDKDDNKILECAAAAMADIIVTMDKDLLKLKNFRNIGIIHPKTFFYLLEK